MRHFLSETPVDARVADLLVGSASRSPPSIPRCSRLFRCFIPRAVNLNGHLRACSLSASRRLAKAPQRDLRLCVRLVLARHVRRHYPSSFAGFFRRDGMPASPDSSATTASMNVVGYELPPSGPLLAKAWVSRLNGILLSAADSVRTPSPCLRRCAGHPAHVQC